jgi:hypothetical protein
LQLDGWAEPNEDIFAQDVRLVLVSADFSKEVTTAVMWLNERDLDIRCIRIKPYRDAEKVLVDVQQIIPLPEAAEYQIKIREKERKERQDRVGRGDREHISEEEFLGDFDAERSPSEQRVARRLLAWAKAKDLRDNFRRGTTGVAFIPEVEDGAYVYYPMSLRSRGWVSIQLRWLKDRPPFSDKQKREQLFQRIKDIPGFAATEAAMEGFPKFPITSLTEPQILERFIATLDWVVEEIRQAPPSL